MLAIRKQPQNPHVRSPAEIVTTRMQANKRANEELLNVYGSPKRRTVFLTACSKRTQLENSFAK